MKKLTYLFLALLIVACSSDDNSNSSSIDGRWNLTSIKYTLVADIGLLYPIRNTYHYTKPTFIDKIQESNIQTKEHVNKIHVPNNLLLKQYFHNQPNYNRYK